MADLKQFNGMLKLPKTQEFLSTVLNEKKSQFVTNITSLVSNDKNLQDCEPLTLMYAGITATTLDLPLNKGLGFAYVIPFKNGKTGTTEAQFQIGYKGFVQLAIRSGQFKTMNVADVREGELEEFDLLSGEISFKAKPNRINLPIIGYVAYFQLTNGFSKTLYMTKEEVEAHGLRYSQTFASKTDYIKKSSKWSTDFDAMAKKTVLKLLLSRWAPLSVDMQSAIEKDQSVMRTEDMTPDYVDNDVVETTAEEVNETTVIASILKAKTKEELSSIIETTPEDIAQSERIKEAVEKKTQTL